MRRQAAICVGLLALCSGCNVAYYAGRNIVNEPKFQIGQMKLRHRFREMAKAAWAEEAKHYERRAFSHAYQDGFIDGYADYLNNGGVPMPPSAPPPRYRRHVDDFSAEGQANERDYIAGFTRGAQAAADSGERNSVVVQLALPEPQVDPPLNIQCIPAGATAPPIPPIPPATNPPGVLPAPPPKPLNPVLPAPLPQPSNPLLPAPKIVVPAIPQGGPLGSRGNPPPVIKRVPVPNPPPPAPMMSYLAAPAGPNAPPPPPPLRWADAEAPPAPAPRLP